MGFEMVDCQNKRSELLGYDYGPPPRHARESFAKNVSLQEVTTYRKVSFQFVDENF